MKMGSFRISERQQIVLVLFIVAVVLALFWRYGVRDIMVQREQNARFRAELERSGFASKTRESLLASLDAERAALARLADEWMQVEERVSAFEEQDELRRSSVLRIDYKVELYRTRQRLDAKAKELGVSLTARDLGMSEEVFTTDDPRTLMLQLRAVEKLVDMALDRRIQTLVKVHPQPPIERHRGNDGRLIAEEFPVEVEVEVSFSNFYDFFRTAFEKGTVFVFRNIKIVSGQVPEAPLRVTAVMSALLFEE